MQCHVSHSVLCRHTPSSTMTLSLHDALPISQAAVSAALVPADSCAATGPSCSTVERCLDPAGEIWHGCVSSTKIGRARLNSSHLVISYAVFCLKKKKQDKASQYEVHREDQES